MYGGHIRNGGFLPALGGGGAASVFGGGGGGSEGGHGGEFTHAAGSSGGVVPHGGGVVPHVAESGGGIHSALPFTGFDSLKLAIFALLLVIVGLLLMRMVMLISNDR